MVFSSWTVLDSQVEKIPNLLVRSSFDSSGYHIEITDLSRIWAENISKEDIVKRASTLGSSIDPGEDEHQLEILQSKIGDAIEGKKGTSLHVRSGKGGNNIFFDIVAPLPKPLPAFKWYLELCRYPEQRLGAAVVLPLILKADLLEQQIQHMTTLLRDKDRVIAKIADRLETSGNDLTTVFPGVSNIKTNRKKSQREQLAKHVKGLAEYDEQQIQLDGAQPSRDSVRLNGIFSGLPESTELHAPAIAEPDWWNSLGTNGETHSTQETRSTANRNVNEDAESEDPEIGHSQDAHDSTFQRQPTPPRTRSSGEGREDLEHSTTRADSLGDGVPSQHIDEDESTTDDDDDLDKPAAPKTSKLPPPDHSAEVSAGNNKTNSLATRQAQPTKSSVKFGTIGGKANGTARPKTSEQSNDASVDTDNEQTPLNSIEVKTEDTDETRNTDTVASKARSSDSTRDSKGLSRDHPEEESIAARQTSEERADQRRDQLKRELQQKAAAPVKKKRRF